MILQLDIVRFQSLTLFHYEVIDKTHVLNDPSFVMLRQLFTTGLHNKNRSYVIERLLAGIKKPNLDTQVSQIRKGFRKVESRENPSSPIQIVTCSWQIEAGYTRI